MPIDRLGVKIFNFIDRHIYSRRPHYSPEDLRGSYAPNERTCAVIIRPHLIPPYLTTTLLAYSPNSTQTTTVDSKSSKKENHPQPVAEQRAQHFYYFSRQFVLFYGDGRVFSSSPLSFCCYIYTCSSLLRLGPIDVPKYKLAKNR